MVSPAERRLSRFLKKYDEMDVDDVYLEMYPDNGAPPVRRAFASIHQRLDSEFDWMNYKARNGEGGHFNADNSRSLLDLLDEIAEMKLSLSKVGHSLVIAPEYERVLDGSKEWLVASGGSPIPPSFTPVAVEKYDTVFGLADSAMELADHSNVSLTVVGEGSFAIVHKFVDPNYGIPIARKRLLKSADARDRERFRREYEIMKDLDFPYILQVYKYDESGNSYTMEFCESTLEKYIRHRNNKPQFGFDVRKRIALQFLYGLNYLHYKGICHRDLSLNNVLMRVYSNEAVTVKLSDFGPAKPKDSDFTKTETEIRGTIVDPTLDRFKDFSPTNDIYVVGFILSYIFKGVKQLIPGTTPLGKIVQKCSNSDPSLRYEKVMQIIGDVENLKTEPTADTAPS